MKGSEKQVKWAMEIMAGALDTINNMKALRKRYDDLDGRRNSNLYKLTWEAIEAVEAEYKAAFESVEDASMVIDARHQLTSEAIARHAEDWMRAHS